MPFISPEPEGREARPDWASVPAEIVLQIQVLLGCRIIHGETAWGGYSPSACFVLTADSGRNFFVKGTHPEQDTHGTQTLRQEIDVYKMWPEIKFFSPAYIGCVEDGSDDGWMLAVFDHVATTPTLPWTIEKIGAVFRLLRRLHFCEKESIPPFLPHASKKNYVEKFLKPEGGWLRLASDPQAAEKFLTLFQDEEGGKKWLSAALPLLCTAQRKVADISGPVGILHQDLRSDNILFELSGTPFLIDWPNACYGPIVLDLAYFFSTVMAESPFEADTLLSLYQQETSGRIGQPELSIALAAISGYLADNAYRRVPEKLPRLRWFQKRTLRAALQWGTELLEIPSCPPFKG